MALKALIVDDASFVRDLVKRAVRNHFPMFEVQEAQNGRKAQSILSRVTFDLILCDWEMPEMSGLELLRWLRQQDNGKQTPFIMITSRGDKSHVIEAIKEGVSEYLGKPFTPEALTSKIIKVMGKRLKAAASEARPAGPVDAFRQSAELLTRGRDVTHEGMGGVAPLSSPSPTASSPLLATNRAPAVKEAAEAPASRNRSLAAVRFAAGTLACVIKAINLNEVKVMARRDQQFPGIMDQAVIDMEVGDGRLARLNGYVHQLQAVDKRVDTDFISLIIRFVDEDPQKLEDLSRFIAKFQQS